MTQPVRRTQFDSPSRPESLETTDSRSTPRAGWRRRSTPTGTTAHPEGRCTSPPGTLCLVGRTAVEAHPEIGEIKSCCPKKRHVGCDLGLGDVPNHHETPCAADRPFGLVEATVQGRGPPEGPVGEVTDARADSRRIAHRRRVDVPGSAGAHRRRPPATPTSRTPRGCPPLHPDRPAIRAGTCGRARGPLGAQARRVPGGGISSAAIASAARRSAGTARRPKSSSTRETGPETEIAVGVGAPGTAMA